MPLLPDLPDAIQRLIAEHVLDLRVEAGAGRILCEQLDDVWRRGGPRRAVATARGWLRGDDALLWHGHTTAHGLPRITAAQRRNVAALGREPWRETHPYCFVPLHRGDGRLDMLDDMNGFPAYCQAALPWGRAGAVRFVYGWSRATLVERRVPVWRVPRYWIVEFPDGLQEGVVAHGPGEAVDCAGEPVRLLEDMRGDLTELDAVPAGALEDRTV
jgi:hypothetical protein